MPEGPRPTPPALTDAGLDGAAFMTGAVIPLDGGQVIDRE
jgi:hypothetical protein